MSHRAIAAVLARDDLASGERLVAFSLASFANIENRAWPGAPAAAARAGLRRSRYLQARDRLVRRGLVVVERRATGRGRSSVVVAGVRRRRAVVGGRDQRGAVRRGTAATARREVRRGCCSRRWRRSRTRTVPFGTSRPSSYAPRPESRTGRTDEPAQACLRRASWCSSAARAAAGTRTSGASPTRARPNASQCVACRECTAVGARPLPPPGAAAARCRSYRAMRRKGGHARTLVRENRPADRCFGVKGGSGSGRFRRRTVRI